MNKLKISKLNKIIILSIITLFSFLFYLSIPALYDYERIRNQLKLELNNKFNLNIEISKKIKYRILPSPHFEVKDSKLNYGTDKKTHILGELKDVKIFVSIKKIYNQDKLVIKDLSISNSVFNLNKDNFYFFKEFLNNQKFIHKIIIKNSKFFFKDKTKTISIFPIKNMKFYKNKKNSNIINVNGLAYNTKFNLNLIKKFNKEEELSFVIKFPSTNLLIKNVFSQVNKKKQISKASSSINFLGSELKTELEINKNIINFKSTKPKILNNQISYSGLIILDPFTMETSLKLKKLNWNELLKSDLFLKNFINGEFKVHNNFNSKILIEVESFLDKIFDSGKINIETQNGLIKLDKSFFKLKNFAKLSLANSTISNIKNSLIFKSDVQVEITKQQKFYSAFQVPKKFRNDLNKINFQIEINLTSGESKFSEIFINSKIRKDLVEIINSHSNSGNLNFLRNNYNWFDIKKFINFFIKEISLV